jgi:hypothetical protein
MINMYTQYYEIEFYLTFYRSRFIRQYIPLYIVMQYFWQLLKIILLSCFKMQKETEFLEQDE